jgi:outer membrane protein OmpU
MKKVLLGTTALVAAGLLAQPALASDPIKLQVKGYYQNLVTFSDTDAANKQDMQFRHEGEVFFIGSTKLDNGLTVGFDAQLEIVNRSDNRWMDETYMWFEGGFGKLLLGGENSAGYLTHVGAPSVGLGFDDRNFGVLDVNGGRTRPGLSGDSEKITYFTPRMAGFQAGVSYNPENDTSGGPYQNRNFGIRNDVTTGVKDIWSVGLNYDGKFDAASIRASIGYETGSAAVSGQDDPSAISVGLNVGFGGFTIGGAYTDRDNMNTGDTYTNGLDSKIYAVGIAYRTGPWGVSALYNYNDNDGQTKNKEYEVAASYQLGAGVQLRGGLQHGDTGSRNLDSTTVFLGTFLTF